ncbi:MAG: hypothetical protein ACNA8W_14775 [Bradymonadaceae bacterium]
MNTDEALWNIEFYQAAARFFWSPQNIGAQKLARDKRKTLPATLENLVTTETTLNHQLNLFFRLAPKSLPGRILSRIFGQQIEDKFTLRTQEDVTRLFLGKDVMQPDFLFNGDAAIASIEMKIGKAHKCSVEQVGKYLLAHSFNEMWSGKRETHCFVLLHERSFDKCWDHDNRIGSCDDLRKELLAYEFPDKTRKGGLDLTQHHSRLEELKRDTLLGNLTYRTLAGILEDEREALPAIEAAETYKRLIDGMLDEFQRAGMLTASAEEVASV